MIAFILPRFDSTFNNAVFRALKDDLKTYRSSMVTHQHQRVVDVIVGGVVVVVLQSESRRQLSNPRRTTAIGYKM